MIRVVTQEEVENWPNFMKYMKDRCDELFNYGEWDDDTQYVIVFSTEDDDWCVVGYATINNAKEGLIEDEGGWHPDSVWKNDRRLKFKIVAEIEE